MSSTAPRWVAGCMTGTSLDGLDVVLARIDGEGLGMRAAFVGQVSHPFDDFLRGELAILATGRPTTPIDYLRAARLLGEAHANALVELRDQFMPSDLAQPEEAKPARPRRFSLICAHGQTIWHAPDEHLSWQLLDPQPIVRRLRCPVVHNMRQADLAAKGEGAPITPLADWVLYRRVGRTRLVINLGGVCNITTINPDNAVGTWGRDVGACNILIDGMVERAVPDATFDEGGQLALAGQPSDVVYETARQHPFYRGQRSRSTGREDFNERWLDTIYDRARQKLDRPEDIVASAVDAVVRLITHETRKSSEQDVILAGGGARNAALVKGLTQRHHLQHVMLSDELGIPCEAREGLAMAVLGALSQDHVPITLAQVTGADRPGRAGSWVYP